MTITKDWIDAGDLEELHGHWFSDTDDLTVAALVEMMELHGYDESKPIVCEHYSDGTYGVINGRHRALAARELGLMVPVLAISSADFVALEEEGNDLDDIERIITGRVIED